LRKKDKAMMQNPRDWPLWPFLPVKREQPDSIEYEVGVMIAQKGKETTVYLVNYWALADKTAKLSEAKTIEYKNIDELLDDGWIVD